MSTLSESPAWKALQKHHQTIAPLHLRQLFSNDPKRFARAEHALLSAEELRLPVHGRKRAVAVETRYRVGEVAVGGSLGETHDDSGGHGRRGIGDRTKLGTIVRPRRLRKQREPIAAQEELGEDRDVNLRVCGKRRDRSLGVRQRLPRYRRQLGEQRAHTARLFGRKKSRPEARRGRLLSRFHQKTTGLGIA